MNTFLIVGGAVILQGLVFFIQKWITGIKIKGLEKKNSVLNNENYGLKKKIEQRDREYKASKDHHNRMKKNNKRNEILKDKREKAETDEEILDVVNDIANRNNRLSNH